VTLNSFLLSAGAIFWLTPCLLAQTPKTTSGVPDGGTREALISIFIPNLAGAPFAATVNTEWVRSLADGTRITLKNHRLIARDGRGRIFQERRLLVADDGRAESVLTQTEITDPVSHEKYICVPQARVCQLEVLHAVETASRMARRAAAQKGEQSLGTQSLGTQEIAGVEAIGTQEIEVIAKGAIGNDSPMLTKREYWYSPQLGLNVLSIREDPRFGTQRFELSAVTLGEPDAKLFAPPEGSKIIDLRKTTEIDAPQTPPQE